MTEHPYKSLPEKAFWRRAVARHSPAEIDPVGTFELVITQNTKVATAGSCFAQHIARSLKKSGFYYYVTEPGHSILGEAVREANNYGTFSARYGNIYTAKQLLQLIDRAYGRFVPSEGPWIDPDGTVRDPFRPAIQPGNYISVAEMEADRRQHLAAVRRMFETLDVFVFTLGLTECWRATADSAVFPLCPGVEGGTFDPLTYMFHNQDTMEVINDMEAFLDRLYEVNPAAEVILTVSPVPLVATAEPNTHVLSATTYSKAVLRVAAETVCRSRCNVHYFPSYEIITGSFSRGAYYASDLRNITENGVAHVMRLFLYHAAGLETSAPPIVSEMHDTSKVHAEFMHQASEFAAVECEEIFLDRLDNDVK